MAFIAIDPTGGIIDLYNVDTAGPGPLAGLGAGPTTRGFANYPGMIVRAYDYALGAAEFMFGKSLGATPFSSVVEIGTVVTAGRYDETAQPWVGTANTGKPLGVALVTLAAGQFGWFQISGNAITTVQGAPAIGNPAYWQAAGVVSPTAVAGKQALGAVFVSAAGAVFGSGAQSLVAYTPTAQVTGGTLSATQAIVLLNRPTAQPQIT
jgi:hypothetical protein